MKTYTVQENIGRARYVVNFHDGAKRHPDGSPFRDVRIFTNKKAKAQFVRALVADGYTERGRQTSVEQIVADVLSRFHALTEAETVLSYVPNEENSRRVGQARLDLVRWILEAAR